MRVSSAATRLLLLLNAWIALCWRNLRKPTSTAQRLNVMLMTRYMRYGSGESECQRWENLDPTFPETTDFVHRVVTLFRTVYGMQSY